MNVLYTFDNNYVQHAIASMVSICRTNSWDMNLVFYVLADSVSNDNIAVIKALEDEFSCKIIITEINGFMSQFESGFDTGGWNETTMARLLMASFLPSDVTRVIYLDCDTIVRNSLEDLWETDLDDNCIGAVVEPTVDRSRMKILGIGERPYFNAGVLLVNLAKWRDLEMEKKILAICAEEGDKLTANDQDALNLAMKDGFYILSPTYNYVNSFYYYPYRLLSELEKPARFPDAQEFRAIQDNPNIIHYLGEDRPWRKNNTHHFTQDYWKNVNQSPYASYAKEEEGWELYFKAWHLFNTLMRPFPKTRLYIIQRLIPVFLQFRAKNRKKTAR